jgi:hypothetical protein
MYHPTSRCDSALWLLANHGDKMERSQLRRYMGVKYAFLNPVLEELAGRAGSG